MIKGGGNESDAAYIVFDILAKKKSNSFVYIVFSTNKSVHNSVIRHPILMEVASKSSIFMLSKSYVKN